MPGRVLERKKRRMPCVVRCEGQQHSGLIVDLSPSGLFVQTSAKAKPGDHIDLDLSVPGETQQLRLQVEVVRQRVVPAQLRTVAQGGVGVRILNAPEAYYRFMTLLKVGHADAENGSATRAPTPGGQGAAVHASRAAAPVPSAGPAAESEAAVAARPVFRVRVSQIGGSRSRRLDLAAEDAQAARAAALDEVGEGWRVLEVEPL